jgi:hypothetical protein
VSLRIIHFFGSSNCVGDASVISNSSGFVLGVSCGGGMYDKFCYSGGVAGEGVVEWRRKEPEYGVPGIGKHTTSGVYSDPLPYYLRKDVRALFGTT